MTRPPLLVTASPHLMAADSTPRIMWTVVATLAPVCAAAAWFFGVGALLIVAVATAGALATERLLGPGGAVRDGSATITGVLLSLTLPPGLPLWMAALGGIVAIGFGKLVFGGLGRNIFNPALLGRAFLQAAFPTALTTWPLPGGGFWQLRGDLFALPFMSARPVDVLTGATPLGLMKFEQRATDLGALLVGSTPGSLGETAALVILAGGAWLAWKRYLNWRIPAGILGVVALFSGGLHLLDPARFAAPAFMLFSGGLMLGAVYMATDLVTSPLSDRGCWLFAAGIGVLVVVIRVWGGLAEGVMYAILIMNAMVPFINRVTQPRLFGARTPAT